MIAKHIKRATPDKYSRLARYIAAASDPGEKLHKLWICGCNSGDKPQDLELAICEIEATQFLNTRSKADKTYHLMVSFKEGEKPDDKQLIEIETAFAKALGFESHQRICATHQNTKHFHIHVAYNKINPKTLNIVDPSWDFRKLEKCCREMEKKYGLGIDLGRADKLGQDPLNTKARDYEARTWQQSFDSYVKDQKTFIKKDLEQSINWDQFNQAIGEYSLKFKPRGAGLVIANLQGTETIKASTLGREFSKQALEARLGTYKASEKAQANTSPKKASKVAKRVNRYKPRPLLKGKAIAPFWRQFMGIKKKDQLKAGGGFATFKEFLIYQALEINDPLAMALIHIHNKIIQDLTSVKKPTQTKGKS